MIRRLALLALVLGCCCAASAAAAEADAARPRFDTQVLALVPAPGFPALAYVHPDGRIYEGTYDNPLGDTVPSRVLEYTGDGSLLRSWVVHGQDLSGAHGVQVATSDARGRLVLLDLAPARALLLDTRTGDQSVYATFPDLPTCPLGTVGTNCSPALVDEPPAPDYAAWGPDGSLYVTDYQQAVVWRVPPGGGTAQVWLADRRLDGTQFGTAGIVLAPDHRTLLISQQSSAGLGDGDPASGKLFSVGIGPDGRPGPLRQLWESRPFDAPDGFAVAQSGRIYVALLLANQIAVLSPAGQELSRFPDGATPLGGPNGSPVPFDSPSSVMFDGDRLIVANQSYVFGTSSGHQAILDVEAGEPGAPQFIPPDAGG